MCQSLLGEWCPLHTEHKMVFMFWGNRNDMCFIITVAYHKGLKLIFHRERSYRQQRVWVRSCISLEKENSLSPAFHPLKLVIFKNKISPRLLVSWGNWSILLHSNWCKIWKFSSSDHKVVRKTCNKNNIDIYLSLGTYYLYFRGTSTSRSHLECCLIHKVRSRVLALIIVFKPPSLLQL